MTEQKKIDGRTKRAADLSLMRRTISRASYDAILAGTLTLAEARLLGRDRGPNVPEDISGPGMATERAPSASAEDHQDTPPRPVSRLSKSDRSRDCLCGCGSRTKGGRFLPGHDVRLVTYAKEYIWGERELTGEQLEYVRESGKLDRAKAQIDKEEHKRQEKERRKAERKGKK